MISGYSVEADVDRGGADDLGSAGSVEAAAAQCSADLRCQGFNSGGWLKGSVETTNPHPGMCLYAKMPTATSECRRQMAVWAGSRHMGGACACAICMHAVLV